MAAPEACRNSASASVTSIAKKGMVVIDAPPLLPVTDAAILGHAADGVLLTVSAGSTLDHELQTALGHLENAQATVLGVVLNRVSRKTAGSGYHGYYGYDEANA